MDQNKEETLHKRISYGDLFRGITTSNIKLLEILERQHHV
jgi:hypothetical protein